MDYDKIIGRFRVEPGRRVDLKKDFDPAWMGQNEFQGLTSDNLKDRSQAFIHENLAELREAQDLLWASDTCSLLIVLQAMDAAGKDSLIKHVMSGLNPQGCQVHSFKQPSPEELDHTFLWRYANAAPERGKIAIFNRSHYEDVLVVKVHPELLDRAKLPPGKRGKGFWKARYEDINNFEEHLSRNGTLILKFFLYISRKEQKKRFLQRLDNPDKHWKFSLADMNERRYWRDYMDAYEEALSATSTAHAPWYVIPADFKWVSRVLVSVILARAIRSLDLHYPAITAAQKRAFAEARRSLASE